MPKLIGFIVVAIAALVAGLVWKRRRDRRRKLRQHTISPEALHRLLTTAQKPNVIDLRVPLDFLGLTEMIPGATKISPREIIANPNMLSKEFEYVLYCTCPGEETSRTVLAAALKLGFSKVKVLSGGIDAWKQKGFPVEEYSLPFHLDVP